MKKYKLTDKTINFLGITLYQIEAIKDFGDVATGELGGFVEKECNLAHGGDAWVYGDAQVSGDARVYGDARVSGDAQVSGDAWVSGDAQVYGDAWVYGDAHVSGDARVSGDAQVSGDAWVSGDAQILTISNIGSDGGTLTIYTTKEAVELTRGCFRGSLSEFESAVNKTHGDNEHGKVYQAAIVLIKTKFSDFLNE